MNERKDELYIGKALEFLDRHEMADLLAGRCSAPGSSIINGRRSRFTLIDTDDNMRMSRSALLAGQDWSIFASTAQSALGAASIGRGGRFAACRADPVLRLFTSGPRRAAGNHHRALAALLMLRFQSR